MTSPRRPQTLIARGSLAAEQLLLDHLGALLGSIDPPDFRRPIWIVVPTRVLRRHLQSRVVAARGSTLGVRIWTLGGLAGELAGCAEPGASASNLAPAVDDNRPTAADDAATNDDLLMEIMAISRLASIREVAMDRGRGAGAVVRDLIDAGLELEHLAPIIDGLADSDATPGEIMRAEQLLRAAGSTRRAVEEEGLTPAYRRFALAQQHLRSDAFHPPSEVLIYGFADLTGVGADFLEAVVASQAGTVILNRPPDPNPTTRIPAIDRYLERWGSRLATAKASAQLAEDSMPEVNLVRAAKPAEELTDIGLRIRSLLDNGVAATSVGVVVRQPAIYGHIAARELQRLGIRCSAPNLPGQLKPGGRRFHAVLDLFEQADATPLSRWLDARVRNPDAAGDDDDNVPTFEIRRRLARAGLRTLGQLARLETGPFDDHRTASDIPTWQVTEARALLSLLRDWGAGPGAHHADRLRTLFAALAWPETDEDAGALLASASAVDIELSASEFLYWLRRSIQQLGRTDSDPWDLGGVRLLRIQDSREVTFEHLFVPGMSRGLFPRAIRPDNELGDELREVLAGNDGLLPDLPVAWRFHDEEKYLFAQLLSSAKHVTLSWSERSFDERTLPRSSLLSLLDPDPDRLAQPAAIIDPDEVKTWASLPPRRRRIEAALRGRPLAASPTPMILASILAEHENLGPGPYLGWVGSDDDASDPRHKQLWVTNLENYARCPWQTFVRRFLGIEERHDPDLAAPDLPPLAVGGIVHHLLEIVARRTGVSDGDWNTILDGEPARLSWPEDGELQQMASEAAADHTRRAGIYLPGYAETLATAVLAVLWRARAADEAGADLLAVESKGVAQIDGRATRFRADRIEVRDGLVLATDYKTGKSKGRNVAAKVSAGELLQLPAYILGGATAARMLYLGDPDRPAGDEVLLQAGERAALDAFGELTATLAAGWQGGRFFPRVLGHGGGRPRTCDWCAFTETCSERDPFARDRLQLALEAGDDPVASRVWDVGKKVKK